MALRTGTEPPFPLSTGCMAWVHWFGRHPREWALPAILLVATLAVWSGVPGGQFQADDFRSIVRDPSTLDPVALGERLGSGLRPLLRLSYFANGYLFGLVPAPFLVTNLILHLTTTLGVYFLARHRLPGQRGALLAAACFAVQPAASETVAYVTGRSTGLSTLLLVLGLYVHQRAKDAATRRVHRLVECASLSLFAAACLAKEVALVFPLLVILWDTSDPTRLATPGAPAHRLRLSAFHCASLALAAFGAGLMLVLSPRYRFLVDYSMALRSPADNLAASVAILPELLSLWFRPWALSIRHDVAPPQMSGVLLGVGLVAVVTGAAALAWRRARLVSMALLWPLLALLPTHSLIAKLELVTEKPLYLAWLGPAIALGAAIDRALVVSTGWRQRLIVALVVATLGVSGYSAHGRAALWADPRLLWQNAVVQAPRDSQAWNNLGFAYLQYGDNDRAELALCRAIELNSSDGAARRNLELLRILGRATKECR